MKDYFLQDSTHGNPLILFEGGPFSQGYHAPFTYRNLVFPTSEHFKMYMKSQLFDFGGQFSTKILEARTPHEAQVYGQQIPNFDAAQWDVVGMEIVTFGNLLKFTQNPGLNRMMRDIDRGTFVACSPMDRIWGIGLDLADHRVISPHHWNGRNQLGICLDEVHTLLR